MAGDNNSHSFTNRVFETLIACYPVLAATPPGLPYSPEQCAHCLPAATQNLQMLFSAVGDHGKEDSALPFNSCPRDPCKGASWHCHLELCFCWLSLHVAGTATHKKLSEYQVVALKSASQRTKSVMYVAPCHIPQASNSFQGSLK